MDFIPTSLIISSSGVLFHLIAHMDNLICALLTPLFIKLVLDISILTNLRPISNLNSISKILESFLHGSRNTCFPNFNPSQSAHCESYSNETALAFTLNSIFSSTDNGKACSSVCLDLSATAYTVDHHPLPSRLSKSFKCLWDCFKLANFLALESVSACEYWYCSIWNFSQYCWCPTGICLRSSLHQSAL